MDIWVGGTSNQVFAARLENCNKILEKMKLLLAKLRAL